MHELEVGIPFETYSEMPIKRTDTSEEVCTGGICSLRWLPTSDRDIVPSMAAESLG